MKMLFTVLGGVVVLLGAVWILQGLGILPGSFMTGHREWCAYGALAAGAGLILIYWAQRRPVA